MRGVSQLRVRRRPAYDQVFPDSDCRASRAPAKISSMRKSDSDSRGLRRFFTAQDREIFALAIPAFATLLSEPLLLLADSAIVGHLGTTQLAGLGLAANVLGVPGRALRLPRLRHDQHGGPPARGG